MKHNFVLKIGKLLRQLKSTIFQIRVGVIKLGINSRDYVQDVEILFTFEEAEQLFIAAGYKEKETAVEGFKSLEITNEILRSNRQFSSQQLKLNFEQNQHLEIQVQQIIAKQPDFDLNITIAREIESNHDLTFSVSVLINAEDDHKGIIRLGCNVNEENK